MRSWWRPLGAASALSLTFGLWAAGCISRADAPFKRLSDQDDAGTGSGLNVEGGTSDASLPPPATLPHAVLGVSPPHGSFAGGSLVMVSGNGFAGNARVWFGDVEVPPASLVPIDPQRIQVTVPAGHAGVVDVRVQNGRDAASNAVLSGGYTYDQFYADPGSGPTSGGTRITLQGDGTHWDEATEVSIDRAPCPIDEVVSETELHCTTPIGTPGSKPIRVATADGVAVDVLDAFVYGNSDNGYKGGLSGGSLRSQLTVLALDNLSGLALPGATVIVGSEPDSSDVLTTDGNGLAVDAKAGLGPTRTVTVARKCYQPQTFVDVPVDTVTVFLDPILAPGCGPPSGDLPPSGGSSVYGASVTGQIVWPATAEFRRDGWLNVPAPKSDDEKLVAYVFRLSANPTERFSMPRAIDAITPSSGGDQGFSFDSFGLPGNFTLYALAGIENRALTPPTFTAYQMGLVRGVAAAAGETKSDVFIRIDADLDHTLSMELSPPTVTTRGPDRVLASASIQVGTEGFAPLPNGFISRNLPLSGPLSFVGVPSLTGSLSGSNYVATARAVTGQAGGTPRSVVGLVTATSTSNPLQIDAFVQVPVLTNPEPNAVWDGKGLGLTQADGGAPVDLFEYEIASGGGLVTWTVVAPSSSPKFSLPELPTDLGLNPGQLTVTVNAARLSNFQYGQLNYRDMSPRGWASYATDVFYARY